MSEKLRSKYYSELDEPAKKRYNEKVRAIGGLDPYCRLESRGKSAFVTAVEWMNWPDVTYADVYNYLILTSSLTYDQLKAYKSLEGYNHFINGWVTNITVTEMNVQPMAKSFLFTALVKHSQRLSLPPLKVWIAVKQSGEVLCAHCSCMAGLGEACSHVAAVLFTAEANTQSKQQFSSTSLPCSWLPTSFQFVNFSKVAEIDFKTPSMKRKLSLLSDCDEGPSEQKKLYTAQIPKPTESELNQFFVNLSKIEGKPVLLTHTPGFSDAYIPVTHLPNFPKPLTDLFDADAMALSYPELLQHCEELYNNYVITADQAELVQKNTQQQAKSKVWFQQKSGRVTASRLKSVISTDVSQPSLSLVKAICYPDAHQFYSAACSYGCKHEESA